MTDSIDNAATLDIPGLTDLHPIGQGGYAVVYRAVEIDLQRTVAVKVIQPLLTDHAKLRFDRERRAMGALSDHPHIVTVYRGGHVGPAGHERPYLVMEYLEGGSLAEHLANQGPLPWERVVEMAVQVTGALETAHRAGVLHRDIKPGNIMISSLGQAKLGDFGIARLKGSPNTRTGLFSATLTHAPPEVMSGSRPDARADLYSLGSTMYELLAGGPAFVRPSDESTAAIVARIATEKPEVLDEHQVPRKVMRAVLDAMAKDPTTRPATAADFGQRLRSVQRELRLAPTPLLVRAIDLDELNTSGQRSTVKVDGPPPSIEREAAERSPTVSFGEPGQPTPANPVPIAPANTATGSGVQPRPTQPPPGPADAKPHRSRRGLWVALGGLGVAVAAVGAAALVVPGLVDDSATTSTTNTTTTDTSATDTSATDTSATDTSATAVENAGSYDFAEIENEAGTVTLRAPTEWGQNQGWRGPLGGGDPDSPAKQGDVQLTLEPPGAAFGDDFETSGSYLWVDRAPFDAEAFGAEPRERLERTSTECGTRGVSTAWTAGPYQGFVATHTVCPGPSGASEIVYAYTDSEDEVLVLLIVHAFDERDREAAETMAGSLAVAQ